MKNTLGLVWIVFAIGILISQFITKVDLTVELWATIIIANIHFAKYL